MRGLFLGPALVVLSTVSFAAEPAKPTSLEPGARVRLTGASSIHLPGLVDMDGRSVQVHGLRILANDGKRVLIEGPAGEMIAVPYPGQRIEGELVSLQKDTYAVAIGGAGGRVTVPRSAIARVDVRLANASRGSHALKGLLVGAALGGALGLIGGSTCNSGDFGCPGPGYGALLGAMAFAPIGLVFGAAGSVDRWQHVGEPQSRQAAGPAAQRGVGVSFRVRF